VAVPICDLYMLRSQVVRRPHPAQEAAAQQWTDPTQDRDLPQLLSLAGAAVSRQHAQDGTKYTHARFSQHLIYGALSPFNLCTRTPHQAPCVLILRTANPGILLRDEKIVG